MKWISTGISGSSLKLIGIFFMLVDHIGATIIQNGVLKNYMGIDIEIGQSLTTLINIKNIQIWVFLYIISRILGRLAFPIFSFLLVEGFLHTKNIKKYSIRLLLFALISEAPFDYALYGSIWYYNANNVFITLFISLLVLIILKQWETTKYRKFNITVIIFGIVLTRFLHSDFATSGIILTSVFYLFRTQKRKRNVFGIVTMCWEITAPFAFIFINLYNKQRGAPLKYFFYLFYPVHLLILGLITYNLF